MLEYLLSGYLGGGTISSSSSSSGDLLGSLFGSAIPSNSSSDPTDFLFDILGGSSSSYGSWFDSGRALRAADYYTENSLSTADMLLTEKNGGYVLSMSKEKWDLVESVQLNVFVDDGAGYIDLGLDNVYEFDGDGDLKVEWDGTWVSLAGHIVPYYMIDDTTDNGVNTVTGRVPALLNGEQVNVIVSFEDGNGAVLGAQRVYANGETDTVAKDLLPIQNGDTLTFLCDYYTYDGAYDASYKLADTLTVSGPITVVNMLLNNSRVEFCYCLTDIYGNEFWTESLIAE